MNTLSPSVSAAAASAAHGVVPMPVQAPKVPGNPPATGPQSPLDLSTVGDLPALPAAVLELLRLLGSDDVDPRTLAAKIAYDQALTAKTLRIANSSFYGVQRHVTSVPDAMTVLGLRAVRALVTAAALVGSFKPPTCQGFDFLGFWRHAIHSAVSARLVANAIGADGEVAFTAGLLHDIGQLVLASAFPERFAQVLARAGGDSEIALQDAERAVLGLDHADVGAHLTERWYFPSQIVEAIGHHHRSCAPGAVAELARIVRVSGALAHGLEVGQIPVVAPSCAELWAGLGLAPAAWSQIAAETAAQAQSICAALLN